MYFGFDEARAGFDDGPLVGEVESEVPGAAAAHGEAAERDALGIDVVVLAHALDGFEDFGLAGPAIGDIGAAENVELDEFVIGGARLGVVVGIDEADLVERRAAAVQIDFEPLRRAGLIVLGDGHGVGLDAAVDARAVGANERSRCAWATTALPAASSLARCMPVSSTARVCAT